MELLWRGGSPSPLEDIPSANRKSSTTSRDNDESCDNSQLHGVVSPCSDIQLDDIRDGEEELFLVRLPLGSVAYMVVGNGKDW